MQSSHPLIDSLWFVPAAEFAKQGIQGKVFIFQSKSMEIDTMLIQISSYRVHGST
jgi:hypothetical protein